MKNKKNAYKKSYETDDFYWDDDGRRLISPTKVLPDSQDPGSFRQKVSKLKLHMQYGVQNDLLAICLFLKNSDEYLCTYSVRNGLVEVYF